MTLPLGIVASGYNVPTIQVEYLVIAGGGSSARDSAVMAGGGGAGGYRSSVSGELSGGGAAAETPIFAVPGNSYLVTVGAGGAAASRPGAGNDGSNSVFHTVTSLGGAGSAYPSANGRTGGSGS